MEHFHSDWTFKPITMLRVNTPIVSIVKKAQQRLYFLRQLRKFNLPQELLNQFYSAIIESVLWTSITVWFSSATKSDLRRLRRVVRTAERIIGTTLPTTTLPTLQELYLSRVSKRAKKMYAIHLYLCKIITIIIIIVPYIYIQYNYWNTHSDKTCIAWMHCKSLWIKASAKCINVNVNYNYN